MQPADRQLRDEVLEELEWEPSLDCAGIEASVEDGVVALSGHVPTFAEKQTAEAVAKRVRGVRAVIETIEVRPLQSDWDDGIARRALNVLDWDVAVPRHAVRVKVARGLVTLSGEVEWEYQRRAAEAAVRRLSGVIGLRNNIRLKPGARPPDVKRLIEEALQRNAELDAGKIRVGVAGGRVVLEGEVKGWVERELAEQAAWSAPGVHAVVDHLSVGA